MNDTAKRRILLEFIRHHREVDDYPIIEFFGAEQVVKKLVKDGLVEQRSRGDGWSLYRVTGEGIRQLEASAGDG